MYISTVRINTRTNAKHIMAHALRRICDSSLLMHECGAIYTLSQFSEFVISQLILDMYIHYCWRANERTNTKHRGTTIATSAMLFHLGLILVAGFIDS